MRHEPGYESTDAKAGATFRAGLYILGTMFLTALLVVPFYRLLARVETRAQPPAAEVVESALSEPSVSFPRLVESEPRALAAFRAQEQALLTSYGRSEEHTSELQSPTNLVCRLLLEK